MGKRYLTTRQKRERTQNIIGWCVIIGTGALLFAWALLDYHIYGMKWIP
jgi:hypothetical protein